MSLGEQLNDLDRKVLGGSPVDRGRPAPPYEPAVGELAPVARSLSVRAWLYGVAALAVGGHMMLDGRWKALLICLAIVVVPALLVAKLSTNAFPAHFPEAPVEALAPAKVSRIDRLVLAGAVLALCVLDLLLFSGQGEEVLFVLAGLPAVVLYAVHAEVREREQEGTVLASPAAHRGRVGRGIYRVADTGAGGEATSD